MALTTKGTAHLWHIKAGVGAVTNATVSSFSIDSEMANTGNTINEIGNKIEDYGDDLTSTGSITVILRTAYVPLTPFAQITYDAVIYNIKKVARSESAGSQQMLTYDIEASEYITLTP